MRIVHTLVVILLVCVTGCDSVRGWETDKAPFVGIRNMYEQPRYDVQEAKPFFDDGRSMRPQVEGTVPADAEADLPVATGRLPDDSGWVLEVPAAVVSRAGGWQRLGERGEARYNIYCVPCHSEAGDGLGMVRRRAEEVGAAGFLPATLHSDRVRHLPDGYVFSTIGNGVRSMPAYKQSIEIDDRWAIVAYVRALQIAGCGRPGADCK